MQTSSSEVTNKLSHLHFLVVGEPVVLALDPGPVYEGLAVSGQSREGASDVTVNLHNLQAKKDTYRLWP
jgi:hypothetical protein